MSMTLKEYIVKENLTPTAWAKKFGFPQPVITRLLAGTRGVSLATALRIHKATGGEVSIESLADTVNGPSSPPLPAPAPETSP